MPITFVYFLIKKPSWKNHVMYLFGDLVQGSFQKGFHVYIK
jgi:hypothetical protein